FITGFFTERIFLIIRQKFSAKLHWTVGGRCWYKVRLRIAQDKPVTAELQRLIKNMIGGIMSRMRVVQVPHPNGPFELVEREIPEPVAGSVRIKVEACGICHSDSFTKEGHWPGIIYPRVPGHEVAGIIDALGPGVAGW